MRKKQVEISVIMGVYNQWDQSVLLTAVQSILHQTFTDFEFIIYDDGSDPIVAEYIRKLGSLDDRIIIVGQEQNHGLAFSLNECIDKAKGRYIARMDADDISLPERFAVQHAFLEEHPEYAWCGTNIEMFDEKGTWGERVYPERPEYEDYLRFSPYVHPTVMYRSEIFQAGEKYYVAPETLRCEDYEMFMRLRRLGYRGYNIQQVLLRYREDKDSYQKRKFRFRMNEARVRYRNFKAMGILFPKGWLYVIRPVVGAFLPNRLIAMLKRKENKRRDG